MKLALFNSHSYEEEYFSRANQGFNHDVKFIGVPLSKESLILADGFKAVCPFVNDMIDAELLNEMKNKSIDIVALRSAGFNNVDLKAAKDLSIQVVRVPAYSPHSVAEHTVGLMLALNRKIHKACSRIKEGDFSLKGLMGFDMHGKNVGIIGAGHIGKVVCKILLGFGCNVRVYDPEIDKNTMELDIKWDHLNNIFEQSDIISLHCPLNSKTKYMINHESIQKMKPGVMLINTSRGGLVNTKDLIKNLKNNHIGSLGLDVYEEESHLFFEDHSDQILQDDTFARLLTFPNVLITGHQAFFTHEALEAISETTLRNLRDLEQLGKCDNELTNALKI